MKKISDKLVSFQGEPSFWCPGCEELHTFYVHEPNQTNGAQWKWDNDKINPTFSPSLVRISDKRCHLFLKKGKIEYLNDCSHELAGQTIDLPDLPEWVMKRF